CFGCHSHLRSFPTRRSSDLMTWPLTFEYFRPSTGTKTACGQSAAAVRSGMAERTPNLRASYEAALTTPRSLGPPPPTTTGLPRRSEEHTSELQSLRHLVCRL